MDLSSGAPSISLRALDQAEAKPVPGTESAYFPVFSPDGQWIAFFNSAANEFKLKKIPVTGGTSITLCEHIAPLGLTWGDDETLVFGGPKGLMRVPSSGGTPEVLTTVDSKKNETAHRWPSYLPGNRALVFSILSGSSSQVAALDLKTRSYRILVANGSDPRYVPTGHLVYYRSGTLFAAPFNAQRLEATGPEAPAVENVANLGGADGGDYSVADSGLLVYMRGAGAGAKTVLHWADRKGLTQPVSDAQQWGTGRLSPDGSKIANSIHSGSNNLGDIWVYDLERRTPTRLTFEGANENPIWTPDGRWITFAGVRQEKHGIYRVAADASGKPELLVETESQANPHSWLPDGKMLVYAAPGADKRSHLWAISWPGGKPFQLHDTPFTEVDGEISPDGRWLAYQSNQSGPGLDEIYVQPFPGPGGKTRISTQGGISPRWSRSGKELFYWSGAPKSLMVVDIQGGPVLRAGIPQQLFKMTAGTTWDVAPDGKRFLVEISESTGSGRRMEAVVNWFDELRRRAPVKR